jgi:hypothetical protein
MASTVEAPFLEVHGDKGAQAIVRMGMPVFVIQGISFGLDNAVNSAFPNVRGVTAQYFSARFSTFGNLFALVLEWPQCTRTIRGSWRLVVDVDMDVQDGLGDVFLEGAHKAGVEGIDLGVLSQEVGRDDVRMG